MLDSHHAALSYAAAVITLFFALLLPSSVSSAPPVSRAVAPGDQSIAEIPFVDISGRYHRMSDLAGQPVLVLPIHTHCPAASPRAASALKRALREAGEDIHSYRTFVFSFDPAESDADLEYFRRRLTLPVPWTIARLAPADIQRLTNALGIRAYRKNGEWVHPGVIAVLSPTLRVAKLLNGVDFPAGAIRRALALGRGSNEWKQWLRPYLICVSIVSS